MKLFKTIALSVVVLAALAATPAFAQLEGTWAGQGNGSFVPPWTPSYITIYPWQHWKGEVEPDPAGVGLRFYGEWYDSLGYHGEFKGNILFGTPTYSVCKGTWTWIDPSGYSQVIGPFEMYFYNEGKCEGKWWIGNSVVPRGKMWGKKVD